MNEQEHRAEVMKQCVAAEPHHSPIWQSVSKDIKNAGKSTTEILEIVADTLE
jgi:pre-mRNA-processing factor 6